MIDSPPWRSPLSEPVKIAYLASTLVVGWVLAIVLALATSPLYSAYSAEASRPGQISALTDQQLAAGVMWVPGSLAYTIAIVLIAYRMLEPPQARRRWQIQQSLSRQELDEMQLITQVFATAGWTSFSAVFSTVFPLLIVLAVLVVVLGGRKTAPVSRPARDGRRQDEGATGQPSHRGGGCGDRCVGRRRCWESGCIG